MIITKSVLKDILYGSSLLGGGGGGKLELAVDLMEDIKIDIPLLSYDSLNSANMGATIFGLGGLKKKGEMRSCMKRCIDIFQARMGRMVDYLIPVEIGPLAVMNVLYMAAELQKPVIDGDIVGYRSAPELYLETITLMDINRCPLVASNSEGEVLIIENIPDPYRLEFMLRKFSEDSKSNVYVAGYPLFKKDLSKVGLQSVSYCHQVGTLLVKGNDYLQGLTSLGFRFIDQGKISEQTELLGGAFTSGSLTILCDENKYELIYRNEFLVLLKNGKEIITCPDSILLLDFDSHQGINNGDDNKNKRVMIFAKRAIPIWRTYKGRELFSPQGLDLPYLQKLI